MEADGAGLAKAVTVTATGIVSIALLGSFFILLFYGYFLFRSFEMSVLTM